MNDVKDDAREVVQGVRFCQRHLGERVGHNDNGVVRQSETRAVLATPRVILRNHTTLRAGAALGQQSTRKAAPSLRAAFQCEGKTVTDNFLTVEQVSNSLLTRPAHNTVTRWCKKGVRGTKLPATTIGGRILIDRDQLKGFLAQVNGGRPVPLAGEQS
jgi:hypothetical protein